MTAVENHKSVNKAVTTIDAPGWACRYLMPTDLRSSVLHADVARPCVAAADG